MPTYQYSCNECGHFFEQFQSFSEDSLTECPECSGRLRKVFNAVGVVFKGSGFYRTDSRSASTATEPAAASASTPASTAASTSTTGSSTGAGAAGTTSASTSSSSSSAGSAA